MMKTVRRLLYRDIAGSVVFVALAFLSLFFFIDFVDELGSIGKQGYTAGQAALASLMEVPYHLYELMPIAVLIGSIFSLARMAQSSEYTILRTGGLGPGRALVLLTGLGLVFTLATWLIGDFAAPASERQAVLIHAQSSGGLSFGRSGAWLKERRSTPEGEHSYSINIAAADSHAGLQGVRIFEFDADGRLVRRIAAQRGRIGADNTWTLQNASVTQWPAPADADAPADAATAPHVDQQQVPQLQWASTLSPGVVASALLPLNTMSTFDLWRYATHLSEQEQATQRYAIQFWRKAIYPLACLVMMGLALPFAYLSSRSGGISLKVFGGILIGISFVLLNNVAGHLGMLREWTPWAVAAAPSALFMLMSLAAFAWLVRYR
jgi:lipopolysaccharide export system permease protein